MKKKRNPLISILALILAALLLLSMAIPVFAEEISTPDTRGYTIAKYHEPSTYWIVIPPYVSVESAWNLIHAGELNISTNEYVTIMVTNLDENGIIWFAHEDGKSTVGKTIKTESIVSDESILQDVPNNCIGLFYGDETVSKVHFTFGKETYGDTPIRAGNYTAKIEFLISLNKIQS